MNSCERKEHLVKIAELINGITTDLDAIRAKIDKLEALYGIEFCEVSVKSERSIQLFSGIDLVAEAFRCKAKEFENKYFLGKYYRYKNREICQLAMPHSRQYREANYHREAVHNLKEDER